MKQFVVDLLDGNNVALGRGPLLSALSASVTHTLDRVGSVSAIIPATDDRLIQLLPAARRFRIRTLGDGDHIGLIRSKVITPGDTPTMALSGPDLLDELSNFTCGIWAIHRDNDANAIVVPNLLSGTGWSIGAMDAGLGSYSAVNDGQTRLTAIQHLRETLGVHFRMGTAYRTVDIGAFGDVGAARMRNVDHFRVAQESRLDELMFISHIERTVDEAGVVNLVEPLGGGEDNGNVNREKVYLGLVPIGNAAWANIRVRPGIRGVQTTTIAGSSGSTWRVASTAGMIPNTEFVNQAWVGVPGDPGATYSNFAIGQIINSTTLTVLGSPGIPPAPPAGWTFITFPQYYVYNATLYTEEAREDTKTWSDIVPADKSRTEDWENAAIMLYSRAVAYLASHQAPQTVYRVGAYNLPTSIRVGDRVPLYFSGQVYRNGLGWTYINVNEDVYIIGITKTWNSDGSRSYELEVSDINRQIIDDDSLIGDAVDQLVSVASRA